MDSTLFRSLELSPEEAWAAIERLVSTVREYGGVFTVLWHQRVLYNREFPGWGTTYKRLLEFLQGIDDICVLTGHEVAQWWAARSRLYCERATHTLSESHWTFLAGSDIEDVVLRVSEPSGLSGHWAICGVEGDVAMSRDANAMLITFPSLAAGSRFTISYER